MYSQMRIEHTINHVLDRIDNWICHDVIRCSFNAVGPIYAGTRLSAGAIQIRIQANV